MKLIIAQTNTQEPTLAAEDIKNSIYEQLGNNTIKAVIFFASFAYDADKIASSMKNAFPTVPVFGTSSLSEIANTNMLQRSISAVAFTDELLEDVKIEVIECIENEPIDVLSAVNSFAKYFGEPMNRMDINKYFGIVFTEYTAKMEESLYDSLGEHTNVVFVGATAADNFEFKHTYVYAEGKAYSKSAVLVLCKSKVSFAFDVVNAFHPVSPNYIVTKSNEANRTILELDGRNAFDVYKESLELSEIGIAKAKNKQPTDILDGIFGVTIDGEVFLRDIISVDDKGAMQLFVGLKEGQEVSIQKCDNILRRTKNALDTMKVKYGNISGMLRFDCCYRWKLLKDQNEIEEYANLFKGIPVVGFCTFGEHYIGPVTQTATFLIFYDIIDK
jgi:hypothetical protein